MPALANRRVAVLVADGFEEIELKDPCDALKAEGARVDIISPNSPQVKAWSKKDWSKLYAVDQSLDQADPNNYDALLLPGGVMNPDKLRMNQKAVAFVTFFLEKQKPIAAICHGPWLLIETQQLSGRKMTSYPSLRTDLKNAGAKWEDAEVVVDKELVTSRKPDDLPAFIKEMIKAFKAH